MSTGRPGRTVVAITARLARRSTIAVCLAVGLYMVFEAFAFDATYPDEASRQALALWAREPGIRILAGPGSAVQTLGGFAVWDAGLYLTLALAAWTLTLATRVLRGDEATGRSDVLLVGAMTPTRMLVLQSVVLLAGCALAGTSIGAALAATGAQFAGAVLFGLMAFGYCAALVALASVACQVFAHRRTALGASAIAFVALILVRMVGNSADSRSWLTWLTPAGWIDRSQAFGDNHWWVAVVPLLVAAALIAVAVVLRRVRDAGSGVIAEREQHRSQRWGLGGATAWAFRSNAGVLGAWLGGIAVAAIVFGALLPTIAEVLAADTGFQQLLSLAGVEEADLTRGVISLWCAILGLALTLYAVFRVGAARGEEESGRADLLLSRPLTRVRWLTGHVLWLAVGMVLLAITGGAAMWLAATVAGAAIEAGDPLGGMLNTLPAAAVFAGLALLLLGVVPRLCVPVGIGAVAATYVIALVGQPLSWPAWLLSLSPFHHMARVPTEAMDWPGAAAMVIVGAALALVGLVAFGRRDLTGD